MTPELIQLQAIFRDKLWTYRELADATGINLKTLYKLLTMADRKPQPRILTRIQRFLESENRWPLETTRKRK